MVTVPSRDELTKLVTPLIPLIEQEGLPTKKVGINHPNDPERTLTIVGDIDIATYLARQKCQERFKALMPKIDKFKMSFKPSSNGHPVDVDVEADKKTKFSTAENQSIKELQAHIRERANAVLTKMSEKIRVPPAPAISVATIKAAMIARLDEMIVTANQMLLGAAQAGDRKAVQAGNQVGTWAELLRARINGRKTFSRISQLKLTRAARKILIDVTKAPAPIQPVAPPTPAKATQTTSSRIYTTPERLVYEVNSPRYKAPVRFSLPRSVFDRMVSAITALGRTRKRFTSHDVQAHLKKTKEQMPGRGWVTKVLTILRKHKALDFTKKKFVLAGEANSDKVARKIWTELQGKP